MYQLSTQSKKVFSLKPIHLRPHQLPALPSAWESLSGMSLRDITAQINMFPPLQVRTAADNEVITVYLHAHTVVSAIEFESTKHSREHLCFEANFLISEHWIHTVRGGNQHQLSSKMKGFKSSIPPSAWQLLKSGLINLNVYLKQCWKLGRIKKQTGKSWN